MITENDAKRLLGRLCTKLGFCLPLSDFERITRNPPADVSSFTDEVFRAEGMDPTGSGDDLYRAVREVAAAAFAASEGLPGPQVGANGRGRDRRAKASTRSHP